MGVDLEKLSTAVEFLVNRKTFLDSVAQLTEAIKRSHESFVWSVIDLSSIDGGLPEGIRSSWIFVLKKDVSSGCHYHPNSIQHMVTITGQGMSKTAGEDRRMVQFGSSNASLTDKWLVINEGVHHEILSRKRGYGSSSPFTPARQASWKKLIARRAKSARMSQQAELPVIWCVVRLQAEKGRRR